MTMRPEQSKTDRDLERLQAAWDAATAEARRVFAEVHFNALDGWPSAQPIRECDAYSPKWSRKAAKRTSGLRWGRRGAV
jgi:hypothetical protein